MAQPSTITLTLAVEEVNIVLAALQEMPFKLSAPVIGKVKQQGDEQMQPSESASEPVEAED